MSDNIVSAFAPKKKATSEEAKVASAIVHFSKAKAKTLKEKLEQNKDKIKEEKKVVKEKVQQLTTLKKTKQSLEERYNHLAQQKRSELVASYRQIVTQLKLNPLIEGFEVDEEKRVIVTTTPLTVQKAGWESPRPIGTYQIRFDFSKRGAGEGIQILNITQRYKDEYDSPHIEKTIPCWGNLGSDVRYEFETQDVYELVNDVCDYICSPSDEDGYLRHSESQTKDKGWEEFLEKAVKFEEPYSFQKWEQDKQVKDNELVQEIPEFHSATRITSDEQLSSRYLQFNDLINIQGTTTVSWGTVASATTPYSPYQDRRPVSEFQAEIHRHLLHIGLLDASAWHFLPMVAPEGGHYVEMLELRMRGDEVLLFVSRVNEPTIRIFLNQRDLNGEALERLQHEPSIAYRVARPVSARYVPYDDVENARRLYGNSPEPQVANEPAETPPEQEQQVAISNNNNEAQGIARVLRGNFGV